MPLNKIVAKGLKNMFETAVNDKTMWDLLLKKSIGYLSELPNSAIGRILQSTDNINKLSSAFISGVDNLEADQVVRTLNSLSDIIRTVTDNKGIVRPTSLSKSMFDIKNLYRCIESGKCVTKGSTIIKENGDRVLVSNEILGIVKEGVKEAHVEMLGNDPALYLGMSLLGNVSGLLFNTDTDINVRSTISDVITDGNMSSVNEEEVIIRGSEAIHAMNTGGF